MKRAWLELIVASILAGFSFAQTPEMLLFIGFWSVEAARESGELPESELERMPEFVRKLMESIRLGRHEVHRLETVKRAGLS